MRNAVEMLPGVGLCILLALAGEALAARAGLAVPGAVLGLLGYALWLASGRGIGWSRPGAALLLRWIGALLVPALVGLQAHAGRLAGAVLPLALLILVTTLVTALATALCFRLAGGRG
jgi:holin-like protein